MSGPLDFYRAITNSATKNAPPPKHDWFADLCIVSAGALLALAVYGAYKLLFGQ